MRDLDLSPKVNSAQQAKQYFDGPTRSRRRRRRKYNIRDTHYERKAIQVRVKPNFVEFSFGSLFTVRGRTIARGQVNSGEHGWTLYSTGLPLSLFRLLADLYWALEHFRILLFDPTTVCKFGHIFTLQKRLFSEGTHKNKNKKNTRKYCQYCRSAIISF